MKATAILPIKRFSAGKQRLATGMSGRGRRDLVAAMAGDVLTALAQARMVEQTILVSAEPRAQEMARAVGAEVLEDPGDRGHSEAARLGIARASESGAEAVILVPGDCPLLDPQEIDGLLTGLPPHHVAVIPDRHGTGTNGLVLSPPDAIPPAFGENSRERHEESALSRGLSCSIENIPSLGLDLDTPADLIALTRAVAEGDDRARRTAKALKL
jgi:2-phospho-L-lactate guanylyltransferase